VFLYCRLRELTRAGEIVGRLMSLKGGDELGAGEGGR
jgi:hypothetical protein